LRYSRLRTYYIRMGVKGQMGFGGGVFHNAPETPIGDHSREALSLALERAHARQPIFFGFLDRILFALEIEWRTSFLQDLKTHHGYECTIFERSQAAWEAHPSNYREIEQMVSRTFELLHGRFIELNPCALILFDLTKAPSCATIPPVQLYLWNSHPEGARDRPDDPPATRLKDRMVRSFGGQVVG